MPEDPPRGPDCLAIGPADEGRARIAALFRRRGMIVTEVDGIAAIPEKLPDLLLLDALMETEGRGLCRRALEQGSYPVLYGNDESLDDPLSWLASGVAEVLDTGQPDDHLELRAALVERRMTEAEGPGDVKLEWMMRAVETMQIGITLADLGGRILYCNTAEAAMHGWERDELLGQSVQIFMPEGHTHRPIDPSRIRELTRWRRESINRRKDGTLFPVRLHSDVLLDAEGRPEGIVTASEDITDFKASRAALIESQSSLAAILENTNDPIWSLDRECRLRTFNTAFADFFTPVLGIEPTQGSSWWELPSETAATPWRQLYQRALEGERFTAEIQVQRGDEEKSLSVSFNPIFSASGIDGACAFAKDVTEQLRSMEAIRALEHRVELARGANDGLWDWDLRNHTINYSSHWKRMLGYKPEEIGSEIDEWLDRVHPDDRDELWADLTAHIDGATSHFEHEHRIRHRDGSWRWMLSRGVVIQDAEGNAARMTGSQIEVTEKRQALDDLRESEQRYALAARGANDGLWDWQLASDEIYLSPRWKAMVGAAQEEIGTDPHEWFSRVHPEDIELLKQTISLHLDDQSPHLEVEHRLKHRDGTYRWMLCRGLAVRTYLGKAIRIAGSITDVTERKRAEEQLLHDAFHDALTGLPNRALLLDRLRQTMERFREDADDRYAVLLLDLDRFQMINDGLGHSVGDQLIIAVAERLTPLLRPVDTLARLGGDEFVLLIDHLGDVTDATKMAERVQAEIRAPFSLSGPEVFISASIGITLADASYQRPEEVLRDADTALHRAKSAGRARHNVFDTEMHVRAVSQLQLETDLRRAIEREQLVLHYQPIVRLESGEISGFEALLRWQHHEQGLLAPNRFIELAEESGLIVALGEWAIAESCRQLRQWEALAPHAAPSMSVNVSGRQLADSHLLAVVKESLEASGASAANLQLEVTESVLMGNFDHGRHLLDELRAVGVKIHLDDFGTGYSSFAYLHQLPIDAIKIDRSFVSRMMKGDAERHIVKTIVDLSHRLEKYVLAEGIEERPQLDQVRAIGCEFAQGYHIARPMTADEAGELLRRRPSW